MKQKISYSSVVSGITIAIFIAFVAIFVLFWVFIDKPYDNVFFWILVGLFALIFCFIFGSIPYSVDVDDDYVGEYRPFHSKKYRLSDIKSAEVGNRSSDRRFHFHGRYKNPVVINLKDGNQYVIGSDDPSQLVDYINNRVA